MSMLKFKFWKLSNGKVMNQIIQSVDIKNACVSKKCSSLFPQMYDKSVSWMEKRAFEHILWLVWIQFLKVECIAFTSQHKSSILIFYGLILESKVVQKLSIEKTVFNKKWSPKLIHSLRWNFSFEKIRLIFDIEKWLWKYDFGTDAMANYKIQHFFLNKVDFWAK